jgi:hypothetical protein
MDGKGALASIDKKVGGLDFKQTKDSLRMQANLIPLADTQKKQERKAKEAAEYRAKILKQKKIDKQHAVEMSPAYNREKTSLLRSKKHKADEEERKRDVDGKGKKSLVLELIAKQLENRRSRQ